MSDEEKKEKEIKIKFKPLSKLNTYHDNIFSQMDKSLMVSGASEVLKSFGASPFEQYAKEYKDIISGNAVSQLLTKINQTIPSAMNSLMHHISGYNKMINQNALNMVKQLNSLASSVPLIALSNVTNQTSQLAKNLSSASEMYSKSLNNFWETQNALIENGVFSSLTENLNRITKTINFELFADISEMIQNDRKYLNDVFNQSFRIEGNSLIIEKEKYPIEEIRTVVEQVIEESGISKVGQDLRQGFNEIKKSITKSNDNNLKIFVLSLIAAIIIQFVFTVFGQEIKDYSHNLFKQKSKTALRKVTEATKQLPNETQIILKSYKIVSVQVLNVRMYAKQKSKKIGELFFGQLVLVKKVQKDWTLIQIVNDDETEKIEGWVFSRYLKKIR